MLLERRRAGARDPELKSRLQGLVAASTFADVPILQRILNEIPARDVLPPATQDEVIAG
jgi:hypothetical protein